MKTIIIVEVWDVITTTLCLVATTRYAYSRSGHHDLPMLIHCFHQRLGNSPIRFFTVFAGFQYGYPDESSSPGRAGLSHRIGPEPGEPMPATLET